MQVIKIALWFVLALALVIFWFANDVRADVDFGLAIVNSRIATLMIAAFLLGLLPMWLLHRTVRWRLKRRITSLEASAYRSIAAETPTPAPAPASPITADPI